MLAKPAPTKQAPTEAPKALSVATRMRHPKMALSMLPRSRRRWRTCGRMAAATRRPAIRNSQYRARMVSEPEGLSPTRRIRKMGSQPAMDHSLPNWKKRSRAKRTAPGLRKSCIAWLNFSKLRELRLVLFATEMDPADNSLWEDVSLKL